MAVPIVSVESLSRGRVHRPLVPRPAARVHEKNVLIAIVVVIEERTSPAHRFGKKLLACGTALVLKVEARRFGNIGKRHGGNLGRLCFADLGFVVGNNLDDLGRILIRLPIRVTSSGDQHDRNQTRRPDKGSADHGIVTFFFLLRFVHQLSFVTQKRESTFTRIIYPPISVRSPLVLCRPGRRRTDLMNRSRQVRTPSPPPGI